MGQKKVTKINEVNFANAMKFMFKNMNDGDTMYLAFSKGHFYTLVFVMGMSVIANSVLISLLVGAPTIVQRTDTLTFVIQLVLSVSAVVAGFFLFLKGVNIVTDR